MGSVNVRELRNHGGDVLNRVARGERLTVVRSGVAVATIAPIAAARLSPAQLVERRKNLPRLDDVAFKADIDAVVEASL